MSDDSQAVIAEAGQRLRAGEVVAIPTETVYGLAANAWNAEAVAEVFALKQRPAFDPLIVHVAEVDEVSRVASEIPETARRLMAHFWPGPLTLVLPKRSDLPPIVTSDLPHVAVRCPAHPTARAVIRAAGVPLAAPSANRFGQISPTTAAHVRETFGDQIGLIVDGGPCAIGVESTVVQVEDQGVTILRPGGVTLEELQAHVETVRCVTDPSTRPSAPGMLARHYAPTTPLTLVPMPHQIGEVVRQSGWRRWGLLCLEDTAYPAEITQAASARMHLSERGDLRQAAATLFAAMRQLDRQGLDGIVAVAVPEEGLGRAINDRLRRAAARDGE